jgi:two-component system, OmpR family, phosphate regulon sensor histidine kinase PhoR
VELDDPSAEAPELRSALEEVRRLSNLLDRLHHAVVTVNRSLRVTYANAAAAELLTGGDPLGTVLVDPWPEPSLCMLAARMFEPHAVPEEARVTLDESRRVYDILALPPDESGEALLVIADATSHVRSQRAEREFVANAAHQLRTPVAAIASAIEVLQGGAKESPEARDRFLAHLDQQCTRLVRLTRALLVLARAQALAEPPALEVVLLRPLLDGIAHGLRPAAGVEVRVECPLHLAALGDRDLLEQAVGNLAENAARQTVEGEVVLGAERGSEGHVRLVISDTGPGGDFPADGTFQRFYRDPAAPGEGFGLGLAIAAEAMRVLGGELHMESTGQGTCATASLPAATVKRR